MERQDYGPSAGSPIRGLVTDRPHSARVWNYWLGGKDHYQVDREFLNRSVRYLGEQKGIRQYLDIGTGLPTMDNTHEVAQRVAPQSRIVYVDHDPMVLSHARALLTSAPEGVTDYLDADLRAPEKILGAAAEILDFSRPIGLMLLAVMHLVVDDEEAYEIVRRLIADLPSGSHLVLTHACTDAETTQTAVQAYNESGVPTPIKGRSRSEIAEFFNGLELVEPGVVSCPQWRSNPSSRGISREVMTYCGVAIKR
jgi:hypothetical protein